MTFIFNRSRRKTLVDAVHAASLVPDFLAEFLDLVAEASVVAAEVGEEDGP